MARGIVGVPQRLHDLQRSPTNTWFPDLRKTENRLNMAILVKF